MKRVLITVHQNSFFSGLFGIASRFKHTLEYEPLVYFAKRYVGVERDSARCGSEHIEVLDDPLRASGDTPNERKPFSFGSSILPLARRLPEPVKRSIVRSLPYELGSLATRIRRIEALLRRERIDLVVLGGDIVHYDTSAYVEAAHRAGIPAVIVAGWMVHQDENAEAFYFDPELSMESWANRAVAWLHPRWVYEYKGRRLVRLGARRLLAREAFGIAPPRPWVLHSGHADAIAVECTATRDACLREGLPSEQVHVTGSINHDAMARRLADAPALRAQLCAELGFSEPGRPLILCALPPDELYRPGGRPECEFRTHDEVVRFWVDTLAAVAGWNVVVSLHPSLLHERFQHVERPNVRLGARHTAEMVVLCDLFLASMSTTIQWATACGKPVINYDVYRYRQHDYDSMGGMITVEESADFRACLQRLTQDRAFFDAQVQRQLECKDHWGKLDGHAGDRLVELFEQLIARYRRRTA